MAPPAIDHLTAGLKPAVFFGTMTSARRPLLGNSEITMPGPGAILKEIHRLRRLAKDLTTRIEQQPRLLKGQQSAVARHEEALKKAQEELKLLKVHTHEKEVTLKANNQQIEKWEKQMSDIISKKEYDALKSESTHARQQVSKLEDEILVALTEIEEKTAELPRLEKALQEARTQASQFEKDSALRLKDLGNQREQTLALLREQEAALGEDVRFQYDRLISAKGEDAMAGVEGRNCTACYTEVTAQMHGDLARHLFTICKSCGRMLYVVE